MKSSPWVSALIAAALAILSTSVAADDAELPASLEDLMQKEVTSVSKKPQKLAHVAAAVQVIHAEDILQSGANTLAGVLRLVPGVDATPFSGNRWSVSVRGFAELFADKLLVLVDGRNAFNTAFSGVSWQDLQFPLDDIERIEVIRGPAAAIWGSNGMNGVINIITKSAASTQGGQLVLSAGALQGSYGKVRWGGKNTDGSVFYRLYGSAQSAPAGLAPAGIGGSGQDTSGHEAAGLRIDGYVGGGLRWDISADLVQNRADTLAYQYKASGSSLEAMTERHQSTALRLRVEQNLADAGNLQFQAAYASTTLDIPYAMRDLRDALDLDFQHRLTVSQMQELVWGVNYRVSRDTIEPGAMMSMNLPSRQMNYIGIFAQDEVIFSDALRMTLGLRLDHNPISGWDSQPTARLSWSLTPGHMLWGAVSQAARAPSRADSGFNRNLAFIGGDLASFKPDTLVVLRGNEEQQSEKLRAYEVGLRSQWLGTVSTDLVLFSHRYSDLLRSPGQTTVAPGFPLTVVNVDVRNGGAMTIHGVELAADWRMASDWRAQLAQTWNNVVNLSAIDPAGTVPDSITSLRLSWSPDPSLTLHAWLRHTAARAGVPSHQQLQRQAFSSLDVYAAWRVRPGLELSLSGQNLNSGHCDVFAGLALVASNADAVPTCQARSVSAQLRMDF
jgi:iron complex outermembrane receptor protein